MRPENYEAKRQPPSNEFELNFGPNHPGIEGNYAFRVKVSGDTVLEGRADAGYLHRGFEKLMENRLWIQNIAITPRICVPDPVPMEVIYCLSVEDLCGLEVPAKAQWLRVLQMEMSRFAAYLFYFGGLGATNGMYTPHYWGMADRDLILDLFEELCGGRVYHIYNIPGGVRRDIPDGWLERVSSTFDYQACLRPRDRFWGLGCPKIFHEAEDTLGYPDNRETDMSEIGKSGREQLEGKKSIAEILDVAISFEKTARDFYRDLAPKVSKNIRWLVEDLAIEEQGHYDLFKSLKSRPDIETHLSSEVATPASDRKFSDAVLLPDLGDSPDDQEVLRYALYREHTAMEQYQSLAETAPDGALRDLFRFLAKEETEHKNELEKLYYEVVHSGGVSGNGTRTVLPDR